MRVLRALKIILKVLLGLILFFFLGELTEAQRDQFGVDYGNRLLVFEVILLAAILYGSHLTRKAGDLGLRNAAGWLLFAVVLGFAAWFLLPSQRLARAIDRYYDLESSAEDYKLHQKAGSYSWERAPDGGGDLVYNPPDPLGVATRVGDWQRRELIARKLELEAAEIRYRKGAVRESARELSTGLAIASAVAVCLAAVEVFFRRATAQAHHTVTTSESSHRW